MVWIDRIYFSYDWIADLLNFRNYGYVNYFDRSQITSKKLVFNHI